MAQVLQDEPLCFSTREIRTTDALRRREAEWLAVWSRTCNRTPFQSPAWGLAWLDEFGRDGEMRALVVQHAEQLRAVLPLIRQSGETAFVVAGAGVSDYLGGCFDVDYPGAAGMLFEHIAKHWPDGSVLQLVGLQPNSALINAHVPEPLVVERTMRRNCPVLSLPSTAEGLAQTLPAKFANQLEYAKRRLMRDFQVEFVSATSRNWQPLLEALFGLHEKRWNERGESGVLRAPSVQAFHRKVVRAFAQLGILRLHVVYLNHRPSAAFYGFKCGHTTFYYLSGFDPEFAKYSVGSVILDYSIRTAIAEGCTEFNFLRGREAYKYRWGARDTVTWQMNIEMRRRE